MIMASLRSILKTKVKRMKTKKKSIGLQVLLCCDSLALRNSVCNYSASRYRGVISTPVLSIGIFLFSE